MGQIILKVLIIMLVLCVFAVPGIILRKTNLVRSDSLYSISNILLCVAQPALIVKAFAVDPIAPTGAVLLNFLWVFLFSVAALFLTWGAAELIFRFMKKPEERRNRDVLVFISTFSNCAFIGIPFIDMFTDGNAEATMYMIVFSVAFNLILWTLGAYLMTQDRKQISLKKAFLNPCTVGSVIGFLLFLVPQINIFDEHAVVVEGYGEFTGMTRDECREAVVAWFEEHGLLDHIEEASPVLVSVECERVVGILPVETVLRLNDELRCARCVAVHNKFLVGVACGDYQDDNHQRGEDLFAVFLKK